MITLAIIVCTPTHTIISHACVIASNGRCLLVRNRDNPSTRCATYSFILLRISTLTNSFIHLLEELHLFLLYFIDVRVLYICSHPRIHSFKCSQSHVVSTLRRFITYVPFLSFSFLFVFFQFYQSLVG